VVGAADGGVAVDCEVLTGCYCLVDKQELLQGMHLVAALGHRVLEVSSSSGLEAG